MIWTHKSSHAHTIAANKDKDKEMYSTSLFITGGHIPDEPEGTNNRNTN